MSSKKRTPYILLVEDSPGDARLTIEAFKDAGNNVEIDIVEDGESALNFLKQLSPYQHKKRPNIVLLDLNLPKIDGREVLQKIKNDPSLKTIPVIILSTSEAPSDISYCYENHSNCFISKPVEIDSFTKVVALIESFWLDTAILP